MYRWCCIRGVGYWSSISSMCNWDSIGSMGNWGTIGIMGNWSSIGSMGNWSSVGSMNCWSRVCGMSYWGSIRYWSCDFSNDWSCNFSYDRCNSVYSRFFVYNSVKSIVWISSVVYGTFGSIGFQEGVASVNNISTTRFVLALSISGVGVTYTICEVVMGWCRGFSVSMTNGSSVSVSDWSCVGMGNWSMDERSVGSI
uniref:Uncharacterized protein LOC114331490 n=1 Tax=Diabrotica virgifera virgifera TaxID=50390 RepID=A0A6P7FLH3_DIAVI